MAAGSWQTARGRLGAQKARRYASCSMNRSLSELPERCGVLVVGAGPAGSAAANVLAKAGLDVVLVDQRSFPRE